MKQNTYDCPWSWDRKAQGDFLVWYLKFDQYGTSTFPKHLMYGGIAYIDLMPKSIPSVFGQTNTW